MSALGLLYLVAAVLAAGLGLAHSILGEKYILIRLFRRTDLPKLFGGTELPYARCALRGISPALLGGALRPCSFSWRNGRYLRLPPLVFWQACFWSARSSRWSHPVGGIWLGRCFWPLASLPSMVRRPNQSLNRTARRRRLRAVRSRPVSLVR